MTSRRTAKVAQALRESISSTILFGLKDPRVKNVTVLDVEVSKDVRSAKVYVSIMADEKAQSLCLHGLNSARGFIQSKVADRLQTRYTPILKFVLDTGVKKSAEAARILNQVLPPIAPESCDGAAVENIDASVPDPPATMRTDDGNNFVNPPRQALNAEPLNESREISS